MYIMVSRVSITKSGMYYLINLISILISRLVLQSKLAIQPNSNARGVQPERLAHVWLKLNTD